MANRPNTEIDESFPCVYETVGGIYTKNFVYRTLTKARNGQSGGSAKQRAAHALAFGYEPIRQYWMGLHSIKLGLGTLTESAKVGTGWQKTQITDHWQVNRSFGCACSEISEFTGWYPPLRAKALAELNSRIRDQKVGLGESLAEFGKTKSMIISTFDRVADAYLGVRRMAKAKSPNDFKKQLTRVCNALGISSAMERQPERVRKYYKAFKKASGPNSRPRDFKKFQQLKKKMGYDALSQDSKSISNDWLAYRYGWLPLYQTVYGSMVAMHAIARRPPTKRVVGRAVEVTPFTDGALNGDFGYMNDGRESSGSWLNRPSMSWRFVWKQQETRRIEFGYYMRLKNSHLATNSQLGLSDPFTLAWELTPFSFVVDWFLNVGDVLEQLSAFNGWDLLAGWETRKQEAVRTIKLVPTYLPQNANLKVEFANPGDYVERDILLTRTPISQQQFFGLHLSVGLNMRRLFDSIALMRQKM